MNIFQFFKLITYWLLIIINQLIHKALFNVKLYFINIINLNYTLQMSYTITVLTKL